MKSIDVTGMKFGYLTVLAREGSRLRKAGVRGMAPTTIWRVRCDCGYEKILNTDRLRKAKTCGRRERCFLAKSVRYPSRDPDEATAGRVFNKYKTRAESFDRRFDLTLQEVAEIIKKDCFYCGLPPSNTPRPNLVLGKMSKYSGIDRIDSTKGYFSANVVPCCGICNRMKLALTREQFINHIERLYRNLFVTPSGNVQ